MGEAGRQIKHWRDEWGYTQEELGQLVGLTKSTICRIETGKRLVNRRERERFIDALHLPSEPFQIACDEDYELAHDNKALQRGLYYCLDEIERVRSHDNPEEAMNQANMAIGRIGMLLERRGNQHHTLLNRDLAIVKIIRSMSLTMLLPRLNFKKQAGRLLCLEEIEALVPYLNKEKDVYYFEQAKLLVFFSHFLAGDFAMARSWLRCHLHQLTLSYTQGLLLRDQLIIECQNERLLRIAWRQAEQKIDKGSLKLMDIARIKEGIAFAAYTLQQWQVAEESINEAKRLYFQTDHERPSVYMQILRTELLVYTHPKLLDEATVILLAERARHFGQAKGFLRHVLNLRTILLRSESPQLREFGEAFLT